MRNKTRQRGGGGRPFVLRQFNPDKQLKADRLVLILGKKGTGKSTVMGHLMHALRYKIPKAVVWSATEGANNFWEKRIPRKYIMTDFKEEVFKAIVDAQMRSFVNAKARLGRDPTPAEVGLAIVFDDMGWCKAFRNSPTFDQLTRNQRHYNIMTFVAMQYAKDVPPCIRGNADYLFALQCNIGSQLKLLQKDYSCVDDYGLFLRIMRRFTNDRGCLVQDNTVATTDPQKQLFHFKADYHLAEKRPWKFGSRVFREG